MIETTYKNGQYHITDGKVHINTTTAQSAELIQDGLFDGVGISYLRAWVD